MPQPQLCTAQQPLSFCKKRACAQYRKDNNIQRPLKPKHKPKAKRQVPSAKRQASSAKQFSDTSEDEQSSGDVTPRKKLPRKSSARSAPVKPAVSDSDTSSREDNDMYHESSPAVSVKSPPVKLTRSKTQTLDGEFVVSKILEGPRKKDNKYLVSWEGYGPEGNTWEPRANLPEECFNCTSDDSGDDEPLHTQLIRKSVVPEPEIVKTAPPLTATFTTATSPILEPLVPPLILRKRTPRIQSVQATPPNFGGRKIGLQADPRDLLDPTLLNKGRLRQRK